MGPPFQAGEPPGAVQLASSGPGGDAEAGGGAFEVGADELAAMTHAGDLAQLRERGGVAGVCALLQVSPGAGIENLDSETARRSAHFGANVFPEKPPKGILFFIWDAMQDFLVQMLFVCAVASLAISIPSQGISEGFYDAIGIFIALFLIITVAAGSNYRQAQQFRALNREKKKIMMEVTRSGHRMRILIDDIVVGDIVHLRTGDHIPTDGLVLAARSLAVDESSLTGESHLVHKSAEQPFLLAGCNVMDGFGDMLTTAVGPRTEWGRVLAAITEDSDDPTPLQVRLMKLAEILGAMGVVIGVAIFLILSIRYLLTSEALKHFTATDGRVLLNYFTIAITVLVIAIPEGLPLAVTLMLAFSVGKMMADKCLVRHLSSCETMGCSTTICSDKTGTLTLNQMTVVSLWAEGEYRKPETCSLDVSRETVQLLNEGLALNTSGSIDQTILGAHPTVSGSPTEKALLSWGLQMGLEFEGVRRAVELLHVEPFNSARKSMAVLVREGPAGTCRVHWKGAAEILLAACARTVGPGHTTTELTEDTRNALSKALKEMGSQSLRTMALAYREVTPEDAAHILESAQAATSPRPSADGGPPAGAQAQQLLPSDGLVLLGIVGIKDPCRPEVPDAVKQCQGAGIMVRMVTGDSVETASAIASECGILTPGGTVMDGPHFRSIDPADMPAALQTLQVIARASPTDKLLLVQHLKAAGQVVAVTGDGTNDAPALHEADVGLAMGLCGTEVAKESADIIILDDNFASIVRAVVWGRSVFSNIQRFLQFQITVNCVALTLTFISAVVTGDSPMTVVQLLWVDLIQDTLGAMALATEPPSERALLSPPIGRSAKIVSGLMWRNIIGQSVYQLTILNVLWFKGKELLHLPGPPGIPHVIDASGEGLPPGDSELVTIIFCTFVFMQVFNQLNSRKLEDWNVFEGVLKNRLFVIIFVIEIVIQVVVAQFLGMISGCVPITAAQWGMCFLLGAGCVPFGMLTKLIPVPGHKPRKRRMRGWKGAFQGGAGQFERLDGAGA